MRAGLLAWIVLNRFRLTQEASKEVGKAWPQIRAIVARFEAGSIGQAAITFCSWVSVVTFCVTPPFTDE